MAAVPSGPYGLFDHNHSSNVEPCAWIGNASLVGLRSPISGSPWPLRNLSVVTRPGSQSVSALQGWINRAQPSSARLPIGRPAGRACPSASCLKIGSWPPHRFGAIAAVRSSAGELRPPAPSAGRRQSGLPPARNQPNNQSVSMELIDKGCGSIPARAFSAKTHGMRRRTARVAGFLGLAPRPPAPDQCLSASLFRGTMAEIPSHHAGPHHHQKESQADQEVHHVRSILSERLIQTRMKLDGSYLNSEAW